MSDLIYLVLALSGFSLLGIAGILLKAGGFLQQLNTLNERHKICPINTVVKDVAVMRRENEIFFRSISLNLGDIIREHTSPERDELIDKMNHERISGPELQKLYTILRNDLLESRSEIPASDGRLIALTILMARVEQKIKVGMGV